MTRPILACSLLAVSIAAVAARPGRSQAPPGAMAGNPELAGREKLGPDSKVRDGVPKGKLEGPFLFRSQVFAGTVRKYWVHVPSNLDPDRPASVLVFQDGARAINPRGVLQVPVVLDNLIAAKQIPPTIGIFVTPGQRGDEFPDSIGTGNPNNRSVEYDSLGDAYARFLIDELLPEIAKTHKLTDDPDRRAIGGSSSGAICAFNVAWERPDRFRKVVSFIGSYTDIRGGHVFPDLVAKAERKPIRVFLQDGSKDLRNAQNPKKDWHLQNRAMVAALAAKGYDMDHVFGEGGHSDNQGGANPARRPPLALARRPQVSRAGPGVIAAPPAAGLGPGDARRAGGDRGGGRSSAIGTWCPSAGPGTSRPGRWGWTSSFHSIGTRSTGSTLTVTAMVSSARPFHNPRLGGTSE